MLKYNIMPDDSNYDEPSDEELKKIEDDLLDY